MKTFAILSALIFTAASCSSQEISSGKVPSVVVNSVSEKYPNATKIDWKKTKDLYEAEFKVNDSTEVELRLAANGQLTASKHEMNPQSLPAAVRAAVQQAYPEHRIDEAEEIRKGAEVYYQVELEGRGKDVQKVYTADGKETTAITYWD